MELGESIKKRFVRSPLGLSGVDRNYKPELHSLIEIPKGSRSTDSEVAQQALNLLLK